MTLELISILVAMAGGLTAVAGLILAGQKETRAHLRRIEAQQGEMREDVSQLRERMARLEGLLEGLRESVAARART